MSYHDEYKQLMNSYSSSFRVKKIIKELDSADVLDALLEAEFIVQLMKKKWNEVSGKALVESEERVNKWLGERSV